MNRTCTDLCGAFCGSFADPRGRAANPAKAPFQGAFCGDDLRQAPAPGDFEDSFTGINAGVFADGPVAPLARRAAPAASRRGAGGEA